MAKVDLILLHAPAVYDFREHSIMFGPVSDMVPSTPVFEMYPLGFTTIGEYLERKGVRVRVVNLAGLMLHKPGFDVERFLSSLECKAFGIDLHWMPHAHGSIEVARILKRLHPDRPVIFGGLSSSVWHEELIEYDAVDYVIRGDSTEGPFNELMQRIKRGGSFSRDDIPNLTWKDATGAVHVNPLSWVPDDMNSISLDYAYPMKSVIRHRDMASNVPFRDWLKYPVTAALTCRGCTHDCVTCGGSATAFRKHFGRDRVAFRDPDLLVNDIRTVQNYIGGPIFVLNDFLQAGAEYTERFIRGLRGTLKNPIGFEFFGPPKDGADFYRLLDANLPDWSVEISVESHDDDVRAAFGKKHYTMDQIEDTIADALDNGCSRFDLYFMTGLPTQTAASVRETADYVKHLYEKFNYDKRLLVFSSPMAPFLDPGSKVFDNSEQYGYTLRAKTLEEHRQRLILPSWKQIMNYESDAMTADEMVEATYDVGQALNRIKGEGGIVDADVAAATDRRIDEAREQMRRLDALLESSKGAPEIGALKEEFERLSESTVAEKTELNWPHSVTASHIINCGILGVKEVAKNVRAAISGEVSAACSDFPYPDQTAGSGPRPRVNAAPSADEAALYIDSEDDFTFGGGDE